MTPLALTSSSRPQADSPCLGVAAPAPKPMLLGEASNAGWTHRAAAACRQAIPIRIRVARGGIAAGSTYRTTLSMPEFGPVGLTVTHGDSYLTVRFDCLSKASHAWLTIKKRALERSLTHAFGRATHVDVAHDESR